MTCATCPKSGIDPQDGLDFALKTTQKPKNHPTKVSLTNHTGVIFHFFTKIRFFSNFTYKLYKENQLTVINILLKFIMTGNPFTTALLM